jgi:hypothetical protein
MNTKPIQLALIIIGLSSCLINAEDDEAKLMQENPDWHITSQVYTNPPYWLIPTNVPFRLAPLNNGKWVWTTNQNAGWDGISLDLSWNEVKRGQVNQQWIKEHRQMYDPSDPPGIANVEEYRHRTWDQKRIWNTNEAVNWLGVWAEDTNTGWRINLRTFETNALKAVTQVLVGSIVTNSGSGLLPSPDGKFAILELLDANGKWCRQRMAPRWRCMAWEIACFQTARLRIIIPRQHGMQLWQGIIQKPFPTWNIHVGI